MVMKKLLLLLLPLLVLIRCAPSVAPPPSLAYNVKLNITFRDSLTGERLDSVLVKIARSPAGKTRTPGETILVRRTLRHKVSGRYRLSMTVKHEGYQAKYIRCINCSNESMKRQVIYLNRKKGVKLIDPGE
jgi:hypothetical protein